MQGDIAFLLVIFFMVGTTFRAAQGLKVVLPNAMSTERILKKRNAQSIWIDKTGLVSVNDNLVSIPGVTPVLSEKIVERLFFEDGVLTQMHRHFVEQDTFSANGKSLMPDGLANLMSDQDLADLIAYLQTLQ